MVEPSSGLAWHLQRIPIIWPVLAPWPACQLPRAAWRLPRSAQSPSARQTRVSKSKVKALSVSPAAYVATAFKNPAMQATSISTNFCFGLFYTIFCLELYDFVHSFWTKMSFFALSCRPPFISQQTTNFYWLYISATGMLSWYGDKIKNAHWGYKWMNKALL